MAPNIFSLENDLKKEFQRKNVVVYNKIWDCVGTDVEKIAIDPDQFLQEKFLLNGKRLKKTLVDVLIFKTHELKGAV